MNTGKAEQLGWRGTAHSAAVVVSIFCVRRPSSMPFGQPLLAMDRAVRMYSWCPCDSQTCCSAASIWSDHCHLSSLASFSASCAAFALRYLSATLPSSSSTVLISAATAVRSASSSARTAAGVAFRSHSHCRLISARSAMRSAFCFCRSASKSANCGPVMSSNKAEQENAPNEMGLSVGLLRFTAPNGGSRTAALIVILPLFVGDQVGSPEPHSAGISSSSRHA